MRIQIECPLSTDRLMEVIKQLSLVDVLLEEGSAEEDALSDASSLVYAVWTAMPDNQPADGLSRWNA